MKVSALYKILQKIDWEPHEHGPNTFRVEHETDEGTLEVYLRLNDNWLIASVVPFLRTKGDNSFELSRWLLRMNRDMYQHKFAYDEDGDVTLTVELPTESLDFSEIETALKRLVSHAVQYLEILRKASGD